MSRALATRCHAGHPFDNANTYTAPSGKRFCRACRTQRSNDHARKKRASRVALGLTGDGKVRILPPHSLPGGGTRPDTLRCARCREWKPDEAFPNNKRLVRRRRRHTYCLECTRAYDRLRRERLRSGASVA